MHNSEIRHADIVRKTASDSSPDDNNNSSPDWVSLRLMQGAQKAGKPALALIGMYPHIFKVIC